MRDGRDIVAYQILRGVYPDHRNGFSSTLVFQNEQS